MTWYNKVMWTEGMFLQPQHFQQQDRHSARQLDARLSCASPWNWGFASLVLDDAALLQGRVALASARGVSLPLTEMRMFRLRGSIFASWMLVWMSGCMGRRSPVKLGAV